MKQDPRMISMDSYDYFLPEERIAQVPLAERDQSKLLILRDGEIRQDIFSNIGDHLPEGGLIIFNETKVIHARLVFRKPTGSRIEVFCLEPYEPSDIQLAFQQMNSCSWKCFIGNAKRWKNENMEMEVDFQGQSLKLVAEKIERVGEAFIIRFSWNRNDLTFSEVLEQLGKIPLPPYIHRETTLEDSIRYQTVFARNEGSVAAPTAGLHFSAAVMESLRKKKLEIGKVTLHVGAGTFKPVSSETLQGHQMHTEQVSISLELIKKLRESIGKPVILVGTTTTRAIESIYWQGLKWINAEPGNPLMEVQQWDPYTLSGERGISVTEALEKVIGVLNVFGCTELNGSTSLLIAPGYEYHFPTILITNFHQPKSTLLLLVSAFAGEDWKNAYDYAIGEQFRFLSYGDSCLFYKKEEF
ncbi:MAG: S-adenosylmethionine:tRNA ribosyltransferase-isomerase [Bacteroidales bacterium]|nr:S-adenosylmethionine:tRNA ribosyltransferase-isomerase [Bacteroidales bacterium]